MPFQPCPHIAETRIQYLWAGQQCENVIHETKLGGWDVASLESVNTAVINELLTDVSIWPTTFKLVQVQSTDLTIEDGFQVTSAFPDNTHGTDEHQSLPNNVAFCLTLRSDVRGRSFRGRLYHAGLHEGIVNENTITDAAAAYIHNMWEDLKESLNGLSGIKQVILSRYTHGVLREGGIGTPVMEITYDTTVDSQRRRLPGRGR